MLNLLILADRHAILWTGLVLREPLDKTRKIDASQLLPRSWDGFGVVFLMKSESSRNPNRPAKGASIKVEPIRELTAISRIKRMLEDDPRNYGLFVFGINTGFRASELVTIRVGQLSHLHAGDTFSLKEPKTGRYRIVTLNRCSARAARRVIAAHPSPRHDAALFWSRKTGSALKASSLTALVKGWCAQADIAGKFGSHTLRKTWGYQQRVRYGEPLSLLTKAYGHSSERQTLAYLCIQDGEIQRLYGNEI